MAKNIPGIKSGDLNQPLSGAVQNSSAPNSSVDQAVPSQGQLTKAIDAGNFAQTKRLYDEAYRGVQRWAREEDRLFKDNERQSLRKLESLKGLIKQEERHLEINKKQLQQLQATGASQQAIAKQTNDILVLENKILHARQQQSQQRGRLDADRKEAQERARHLDQYRDRYEDHSRQIAKIDAERQRSFGAAMGRNNMNPRRAAEDWANRRIQHHMPAAFGGEEAEAEGVGFGASMMKMGPGLAVLAGIKAAMMAVEKLVDVAKRSVQASFKFSDITKSGTPLGYTAKDLREEIRSNVEGYGVTLDEEPILAAKMSSMYGRASTGGLGRAVRAGVMQDRAYGMELGTMGGFVGSMLRNTRTSDSAQDLNRLSIGIADAVGRGKLVGLEQEMVKGIMQLVDLTKQTSLNGASPLMLANMISGISSSGFKGMKGEDAAQIIASMQQGMSNPQTPYAEFVSFQALRDVSKTHKFSGMDNFFQQMIYRSQGMGLVDDEGKSVGNDLFRATLKQIDQNTLGDSAAAAVSLSSNYKAISMAKAQELFRRDAKGVTNYDKWLGSSDSVISQFNMNEEGLFANSGNIDFVKNIGERMQLLKEQNPNQSEADRKAQALKDVVNDMTKPGRMNKADAKKIREAFESGGSVDDKFKAIAKAGQEISAMTPEDKSRELLAEIDKKIALIAQAAVPALNLLSGWLIGGADKNSEEFKAAQKAYRKEQAAAEEAKDENKTTDDHVGKVVNYEDIPNEAGNKLEKKYGELFTKASQIEHGKKGGRDYRAWAGSVEDQGKFFNAGIFNFTSYLGKGSRHSTLDDYLDFVGQQNPEYKKQIEELYTKDGIRMGSVQVNKDEITKKGSHLNQILKTIMGDTTSLQEQFYVQRYIEPAANAITKNMKTNDPNDYRNPELLGVVADMKRVGVSGLDGMLQRAGDKYKNPRDQANHMTYEYDDYLKRINYKGREELIKNMRADLSVQQAKDDAAKNDVPKQTPDQQAATVAQNQPPQNIKFDATINQNTTTNSLPTSSNSINLSDSFRVNRGQPVAFKRYVNQDIQHSGV